MENHCFRVSELSSHFSLLAAKNFHGAPVVQKIVCQVGAKQLTPEHKAKCMESALTFLQMYHEDGNKFLDRIIAGDKTSIAHITTETKQQLMHWNLSGSPCKTKFKKTLSEQQVMCTVFWDRQSIHLVDFLTRGETVNPKHYCKTLQKLLWDIQNKRCLVPVLSCCSITLGHTQLDGQHISCRSSAGRCLIIHPIARRISHPVISIISYTSRNSCPISIFRMTERRR